MNRRDWLKRTSLALAGGLVLGDEVMEQYARLTHKRVFALGVPQYFRVPFDVHVTRQNCLTLAPEQMESWFIARQTHERYRDALWAKYGAEWRHHERPMQIGDVKRTMRHVVGGFMGINPSEIRTTGFVYLKDTGLI